MRIENVYDFFFLPHHLLNGGFKRLQCISFQFFSSMEIVVLFVFNRVSGVLVQRFQINICCTFETEENVIFILIVFLLSWPEIVELREKNARRLVFFFFFLFYRVCYKMSNVTLLTIDDGALTSDFINIKRFTRKNLYSKNIFHSFFWPDNEGKEKWFGDIFYMQWNQANFLMFYFNVTISFPTSSNFNFDYMHELYI